MKDKKEDSAKRKEEKKRRKRRDYVSIHIVVDPEIHDRMKSLIHRRDLEPLGVKTISGAYELAAELLIYVLGE